MALTCEEGFKKCIKEVDENSLKKIVFETTYKECLEKCK